MDASTGIQEGNENESYRKGQTIDLRLSSSCKIAEKIHDQDTEDRESLRSRIAGVESTTSVVCPIFINFTKRIDIGRNENMYGVTKLRSKIYVLCRGSPKVILAFEDLSPFRLHKQIEIKEIKYPWDIGSCEKENCLYVSDNDEKCVWKNTRETDDQSKIIKWLTTDYPPSTLSVSSDGQLLVVSYSSSILWIYGSDAELIRSIQLPRDIEKPIHAVEISTGNFIILHICMEKEEKCESWSSGIERKKKWSVSELTRDGQMVVRRFIPSNETQQLDQPNYLSLDSHDRVFVADQGNDRVILLDSSLQWNRILCPTNEETERTKIRYPYRLCFDEEKKQLIVGDYSGANVYTLWS